MATKSVSIRIEDEMLERPGSIADYEGRSMNNHLLVLICDNIRDYETGHGKLKETLNRM